MTLILQVSDPHFGTERPPVVEALVALTHELAPDLLVLSGDITQRARRAQFETARVFVSRLNVPRVLAIPGNHDYGTPNAEGYFTYFGPRAGLDRRGFYAFRAASWKVVMLGSGRWPRAAARSVT